MASSSSRRSSSSDRSSNKSKIVGTDGPLREVERGRRKWSLELPSPHPQVTFKGLLAGCLVGAVCSFLALYYGLKTGIIPSLNILSGLGGFVFIRAFMKMGIFRGVFTPQENAAVQTAAVATYAASTPGFGFSSSYLAMLNKTYALVGDVDGNNASDVIEDSWWMEFVWCIGLGFFGLFLAFPIREPMVLKQRLVFPSGTATAYVIKSMHSSADKAKHSFAILSKFFSIAFCVNCITWIFDGLGSFPIFGMYALDYGWYFDWDIGSVGIGFILSNQVNFSIFFGGLFAHGFLAPLLDHTVAGPDPDDWYDPENLASPYLDYGAYTLFGSLAIMILQGVLSIVLLVWMLITESDWYVSRWGKKDEDEMDERSKGLTPEELEKQQVLDSIFRSSGGWIYKWGPLIGYLAFGVVCMLIMQFLFDTEWYMVLVALTIIPVFAISNIQGMGRTDWDVASSYGKIMMFPFGAWSAGTSSSIIPALVTCTVTISGCSNSATLMQDFKTGYLLGATPTAMFIAQIVGQFFGCLVTPTIFTLLNTAFDIPSNDVGSFIPGMYGPIYRTLAIVATGGGFSSLPKNTLWLSLGFLLLAGLLDILSIFGPKKLSKWLPDPTAMAIGMLVGAGPPFKFFLGGMLRSFWMHFEPEVAKERSPYIASGCIAGSGCAVVLQCVLSLAGLYGPVVVGYASNPLQDMNAGRWVAAVLFLMVPLGIAACGAWYWFPPPPSASAEDEMDDVLKTKNLDFVERLPTTNSGVELVEAKAESHASAISSHRRRSESSSRSS